MTTEAGLWHIKNTSWSIFSYPLRILKASIKSPLNNNDFIIIMASFGDGDRSYRSFDTVDWRTTYVTQWRNHEVRLVRMNHFRASHHPCIKPLSIMLSCQNIILRFHSTPMLHNFPDFRPSDHLANLFPKSCVRPGVRSHCGVDRYNTDTYLAG